MNVYPDFRQLLSSIVARDAMAVINSYIAVTVQRVVLERPLQNFTLKVCNGIRSFLNGVRLVVKSPRHYRYVDHDL